MRRIPFIIIDNNKVKYICPNCKHVISRSWYKEKDTCPYCNSYINRYAETIKKVYKILDEEFYKLFI